MASLAQQFTGLRCQPPSSRFPEKRKRTQKVGAFASPIVSAVAVSNKQTKDRRELKKMFEEAYERCRTAPMEGVSFTLEDFQTALEKNDFDSELGTTAKGTVFFTDAYGAMVDITAKSSAYLPVQEASIYKIKHVEEAGIVPGIREEFVIIGENEADNSLILSLRAIQYELAWERCRQLQAEDIVVKGKVVGANKGGVVALVEGLRGFVPFSQISSKSTAEELLGKDLPAIPPLSSSSFQNFAFPLFFLHYQEFQDPLCLHFPDLCCRRKLLLAMTLANGNAHQVTNNGDVSKPFKIFVGYDPREDLAYEVCCHSILKRSSVPVEITPIVQSDLRKKGLYWRERGPLESTEFSFSRFLTPFLANYDGWAMFVDCDFLYLADIKELTELIDDKYAIMCVHHDYSPKETTKMDGAVQTVYPRKNWSSMVLYNCGHPKNKGLTPEVVNKQTGAFLHRFQWLEDDEIGSVPFVWNFLEGHNKVIENDSTTFPKAIHYTRGGPWFEAWKNCEFADLWVKEMQEYMEEKKSNAN